VKVLITGAAGMLGQQVTREFRQRGQQVFPFDHGTLDITDLPVVRITLARVAPDVVVNCAAYTAVDKAETERETAFAVNAIGPRNLALACGEVGAALVHVSTDYVFDGDKAEPYVIWDPLQPLSVYGLSKAWGENYVRSLLTRYYLVRTSWLFGPGGSNFVDRILRSAREGQPLRVVNDQRGSPTFTVDLAGGIADLVMRGAYGIYHLTNQGITTWYQLACLVLSQAGLSVPIRPISTRELNRPARRPANSVLDPFPVRETIGRLLPPWPDAITRYLNEVGT